MREQAGGSFLVPTSSHLKYTTFPCGWKRAFVPVPSHRSLNVGFWGPIDQILALERNGQCTQSTHVIYVILYIAVLARGIMEHWAFQPWTFVSLLVGEFECGLLSINSTINSNDLLSPHCAAAENTVLMTSGFALGQSELYFCSSTPGQDLYIYCIVGNFHEWPNSWRLYHKSFRLEYIRIAIH